MRCLRSRNDRQRRRRVWCAVLALCASSLPAIQASGQTQNAGETSRADRITVRTGKHPGYDRIVFDWTQPVTADVQRQGDTVTIRFNRPAELDLRGARPRALPNVGQVTQASSQPLTAQISVAANAPIRQSRSGTKFVLDVLDPPKGAAAEPPQSAAAEPSSGAAQPRPAQKPVPAAEAPAPAAAPNPVAPASPVAEPAPPRAVAAPESPKPVPAATDEPKPPPVSSEGAAKQPAPAAAPRPAADRDAEAVIRVVPPQAVAAAAFVREGVFWLVFDAALSNVPPEITGRQASDFAKPARLALENATAFRWPMPGDLEVKMRRSGLAWEAVLSPGQARSGPDKPIVVSTEPDPRLLVPIEGATRAIVANDPDVGDHLVIVPSTAPGAAFTENRRYPELEVLNAVQGVVLRPAVDDLQVTPRQDGVEVVAPGGLKLSRQQAAKPGQTAEPTRLFDLAAWRRGPVEQFEENRRKLEQELALAKDDSERARLLLALARFNFAHGYGPEAHGLLRLASQALPELEASPDFRALRGATRALAGASEGAIEDLSSGLIAQQPEAALWRGYAQAEAQRWADANASFRAAQGLAADYPEPFAARMALRAAEAALQAKDTAIALRLLDRVAALKPADRSTQAGLAYFRGELAHQTGDPAAAMKHWTQAIATNDTLYRARAELAFIKLALETNKMSRAQAIDRLERLRFTWRGDGLEREVAERLGRLYLEDGQYRAGLTALRDAAELATGTPAAEPLKRELSAAFAKLYTEAGAKSVTPLEALSLYQDFKDLTPPGAAGDEMIRGMAERLVQIDLLGRAADLLEQQVKSRLTGIDKGKVGARLAAIRLLDGNPEAALRALADSEDKGYPPELAAERRLLQARALSKAGKPEEALALLKGDHSPTTDRLRVDIAWRSQRWDEAAAALGRIIGPAPNGGSVDEPTARLVLNRAVALALAGDAKGLDELRNTFGPAVEKTEAAEAFRVVTQPPQDGSLGNLESIRSRMAEVDLFQGFLTAYRQKLGGV